MKNAYRPLIIAIAIAGAIFLGSKLMPAGNSLIFSASSVTGIYKLNEILNYIEESYVDSVEKEKLIEDGIESMLRDLDPHSFYIPKDKFKSVNESLEGNFEGIGIEFRIINDTVMVITTIKSGPSEKAGLEAGDRIVSVNDSVVAGIGIENKDIIKKLKGKQYTKVNVGIKRKNEINIKHVEIIRDKIPITSVECSYMINNSIGYIRVNRFSKNTMDEFNLATEILLDLGMKSYVVDLRNNPGGLLNQSIDMANEFLKKDNLIVYTEGKSRPKKVYYANEKGTLQNINLVVLLDEGSASASEVFAGAIQDNDRGLIVGRRSFGKGLVQEQIDWPDGSALRLTVARYYTPAGRSIQKPYKDVENYHLETYNRIKNGELNSEDSIHINDSLKFYTSQGRVVYGGGGIVPDVFVPVDSLNYNSFYNELYRMMAMQNHSFHFVDNQRRVLIQEYPTWQDFNQSFKINDADYEKFLEFASNLGVERNPIQAALMKNKILIDLKAQYARHLYGNNGYFPILNQTDKAIVKSITLFE